MGIPQGRIRYQLPILTMESRLIKAGTPVNGMLFTVARAGQGRLAARKEYGLRERISGFLVLVRPIFFILTPVNAASAVVLALNGYPSWTLCLLGFIAVAFASCATNVFNDFVDRERDKLIWPNRPVPSGRVKPYEALLVVIASLAICLSIAWFVFNPTTFIILLLAVILGAFYSIHLRNRVGYLALPPIVGMIYLGGWAAFSPETLFSSLIPWYLYILGVVWQTAHIMVYYPLHIVSGKSRTKAPPALLFTPSPRAAVILGVVFTFLTIVLSAGLFFFTSLGLLYLFLVIAVGIYALLNGLRLAGDTSSRSKGLRAFTSLSIYRLVISAAILLAVFISQI